MTSDWACEVTAQRSAPKLLASRVSKQSKTIKARSYKRDFGKRNFELVWASSLQHQIRAILGKISQNLK